MSLSKEMRKIKYCLGLKIENKSNEILIHQSAYVEKILKNEKDKILSRPGD